MSFADVVEEVRRLPTEAKVELLHVIDSDLSEQIIDDLHTTHLNAVAEYEAGRLEFTSDPDELIRQLEADD